jgi:micrococcal nuclease
VVDGDTIEVAIEGQEYKVRYIGIDTPESVDPRRPVECFGKEAADKNQELVEGKIVGLEKDVSETDAFGRLLRYVWLDGRLINARLVSEGYALAATYPPDVRYSELFAQLQAEARASALGLWGSACETAAPSPAVHVTPEPGECEFSRTAELMIKGNISVRDSEKIYHVPGGEFYDETVISEGSGERWFCTEVEAVLAGWRRSLR